MRLATFSLAALLCGAAPASLACGYDGMAMDLALAHPASLEVSLAIHRAYQGKLMAPPLPLPGAFGMRRALKAMDRLAAMLPADGERFSLLLVEPGLWTRFEKRDGHWQPTPHTTGPAEGEDVVIVGEGALLAMLGGKLSTRQALEHGLLHVEGGTQQAGLWQSVDLSHGTRQ